MLPNNDGDTVRPETFAMAYRIACGNRLSLAIPVLCHIYRAFDLITNGYDPNKSSACFPVHYVSAWLGLYFAGSFSRDDEDDTKPMMIMIANREAHKYKARKARLLLRSFDDGIVPGDVTWRPVRGGVGV